MNRLFDGYLVVDWSANARPKTGKDSIWWCHVTHADGQSILVETSNPSTRAAAFNQIRSILLKYRDTARRILLGMDFAYGYPQGFADQLVPGASQPWKAVWHYLHQHIRDNEVNANNRFEVAAIMNRLLTNTHAPFWGCPKSWQSDFLRTKRPRGKLGERFREFRIAEQACSAQSVWKLLYAGSVGSQVLMGVPYLYQLVIDKTLAEVSRVWPFQTGLRPLNRELLADINVLHAEIYPSLIPINMNGHKVKDVMQVEGLAHLFARLDHDGQLGQLFAGEQPLSTTQRCVVEHEEGWILGI